jgi:hypothetical protein
LDDARKRKERGLMEPCRGFKDWLECLNCPNLCTKSCPIEGEDALEKMKRQMRVSAVPEMNEPKKQFEIK